MPWGILMRSENRLDGRREYLLGTTKHPCRREIFETRKEARAFIDEHYGYIRRRPDLRQEPHGWRMPIPVRVEVRVEVRVVAA